MTGISEKWQDGHSTKRFPVSGVDVLAKEQEVFALVDKR